MTPRRRMRPAGLLQSLKWCGYGSLMLYIGPALAVLARPDLIR